MKRICYFCSKSLSAVLVAGKTVMPGYCLRCKQAKDQELGSGWERQEWARFLFADVSREAYADAREAAHMRLDDLSETVAAPTPSLPGASGVASEVPSEYQAMYALVCTSGLGARRLQRVLAEAGEELSLWRVQEALRVARREGLRAETGGSTPGSL